MKMNKEDFNAGSPYSSWLKEELIGEITGHLHGLKNRGLVKKFKIYVDDETENIIMGIIKMELDKDFKCL